MGKSGYTSLSIEEKRYARLRRDFETHVNTDSTFTVWAMDTLESAIKRNTKINEMFPNFQFIGSSKEGTVVIKDKKDLVEVTVNKNKISCNVDKVYCDHCMFVFMHPSFLA